MQGRTLLSLAAAQDDSKLFMFVVERTEAKNGPFSEEVSAYAESVGVSLANAVAESKVEVEANSKVEAEAEAEAEVEVEVEADMVHL